MKKNGKEDLMLQWGAVIEQKFCELVSSFVMYCLEHAMCQDEFGLCVNDGLHNLSTSGPEWTKN